MTRVVGRGTEMEDVIDSLGGYTKKVPILIPIFVEVFALFIVKMEEPKSKGKSVIVIGMRPSAPL
jgi:hypothetical protein